MIQAPDLVVSSSEAACLTPSGTRIGEYLTFWPLFEPIVPRVLAKIGHCHYSSDKFLGKVNKIDAKRNVWAIFTKVGRLFAQNIWSLYTGRYMWVVSPRTETSCRELGE